MYKLDLPNKCGLELVTEVVAERQNGKNAKFFSGIEAEWRERVQRYNDHGGNPEHDLKWPAVKGNETKFLTLYASPGPQAVQKAILDQLRNRKIQLCPACGEDGTPNTLDHFLPKTHYPHYAITPSNLFPMCDICQGHKGTSALDDKGRRLFLHPYFDGFLSTQLLKLKIMPDYNKPSAFKLMLHPALEDDNADLVARHVTELHIKERYYTFLETEYFRLLRNVSEIREAKVHFDTAMGLFKKNALDKAQNNWTHLLYDGVMADDALMDHLRNGDLPPYI